MSKYHYDGGTFDKVLLIVMGGGLLLATIYIVWTYLREERPAGEGRRLRRRKRAKRLLEVEHAREKETEKVLPRAVATVHHEPKRDTNDS